MVGSGDGVVRVYYDPDRSVNGARLCAVRTRAKVKQTDYVSNLPIIAPYSLPMFREVILIFILHPIYTIPINSNYDPNN